MDESYLGDLDILYKVAGAWVIIKVRIFGDVKQNIDYIYIYIYITSCNTGLASALNKYTLKDRHRNILVC